MYSLMLGTGEPLHCECREGKGVPDSVGDDKECHQNGDGGHDALLEEREAKAEEHNANGSADSPTEGQQ